MKGARGFLFLLFLLLPVWVSVPMAAMVPQSVEEIARQAESVVIAQVTDLDVHWTDDGLIVTDVSLRVEESWKGALGDGEIITVRVLGGEVGDRGLWVEHEPRFTRGEQTLIFLRRSDGLRRVQAAEQGRLRIVGGEALDHLQRPHDLSALRERVRSTVSPREER